MQITVTANSDKRYYLDEGLIKESDSLLATMDRFNAIKVDLYEQLYKKTFFGTGPLVSATYSAYLKDKYGTNDYYNAAVYAAASGALSSQKELRKLYIQTSKEDIKAREIKISSTRKDLNKALAVKSVIITYTKSGKWKQPYKGCQLKVKGGMIMISGNKEVPIPEYEASLDSRIARLRTRLKQLTFGLSRKQQKLDNLKDLPPKRIIFGTKKQYSKKDAADDAEELEAWKKEFHAARAHSMALPGRHTAKYCNFLAKDIGGELNVTCMDGKTAKFKNFTLARYQDEYYAMLSAAPKERKSMCYSFTRHTDHKGREYIIVSVTMVLENKYANHGFSAGCVAIDKNWDRLDLSDLDGNGKRVGGFTIPLDLEGKTAGQIRDIIGRAMDIVGAYCEQVKKPLAIEEADTTVSKAGMRYGNKAGNRHASLFASRQIDASAMNQGYRRGFEVYQVNPAYTSLIGKVKFMRPMGVSIHMAASYAIGLKAMGRLDLLALPKGISTLIPDNPDRPMGLWQAWGKVYRAFSGIRTHTFYRELPDPGTLKKPTLAGLAKAIKEVDIQKQTAPGLERLPA